MVEEATQKARVLIEALPYIQAFRDAWVVVKFGGSAMEDAATIEGVLQDIVFMECVGMRPIIVHGGGKAISRGMAAHGIQAQFIKGLRVTCEKTIEIVEKVIKGEVNPRIVDTINALGGRAEALHGDDVLHVTRKQETDPDTGEVVDWGFVGEPGEVEEGPIRAIVERALFRSSRRWARARTARCTTSTRTSRQRPSRRRCRYASSSSCPTCPGCCAIRTMRTH